ncbi:MAG: OB-fold putative lipoprotein [Bacteroidales bacterium]|nr:OB-fold putative lipoprotein [Bacteroidales bacterium]
MKKSVKYLLFVGIVTIIIIGGIGLYMYYMPHRDVQSEKASYTVKAEQFVNDFMNNISESNAKYLDNVVIVSGTVSEISEDQLKQKVIVLKTENSGVSCTFIKETNANAEKLSAGNQVKIKGIVRMGASYDEDLDLAEYAILEKCDIVK